VPYGQGGEAVVAYPHVIAWELLPDELRDTAADAAGLVRRVDGVFTPAG
jgi:hypothetical protein